MKKFSISSILLTIICFLLSNNANEKKLNNIFFENVEALAQNESNYYANGKGSTLVCGATKNGGRCKNQLILCEGGGKGCIEIRCPDHD